MAVLGSFKRNWGEQNTSAQHTRLLPPTLAFYQPTWTHIRMWVEVLSIEMFNLKLHPTFPTTQTIIIHHHLCHFNQKFKLHPTFPTTGTIIIHHHLCHFNQKNINQKKESTLNQFLHPQIIIRSLMV